MGKPPAPLKDLKDAVDVFVGTIQDVTKSDKLSKALKKDLGDKRVCVLSFEYSGFQSHILIRNACKKQGLPCIYEKHAATQGHVILLSDVNALLNGICKEAKTSCPKMTKMPKIKRIAGGNAVLSKDTSERLIEHLKSEDSSEEEESETEDADDSSSDEKKTVVKPKGKKKPKAKAKANISKTIAKKKKPVTEVDFDLTSDHEEAQESSDEDDDDDEDDEDDEDSDDESFIDDEDVEAVMDDDEEYKETEDDALRAEDDEDMEPSTLKQKKHASKRSKGGTVIKQLFKEDPSKDKAKMARLTEESSKKSKMISALKKKIKV